MNDILSIILGLIIVVSLFFTLIFSFEYIGQQIEYNYWNEWEYRVIQDNTYWFTNDYQEKNGCIEFISNYDTNVVWCEKYQVEDNYWNKNKPNLTTVIFGY